MHEQPLLESHPPEQRRPATMPGVKNQGDHATAYGLVKRGFYRLLKTDYLLSDSEDPAKQVRRVRKRIYSFLKRLTVLMQVSKYQMKRGMDPERAEYEKVEFEKLTKKMDIVLKHYSDLRASKQGLRHTKKIYSNEIVRDVVREIQATEFDQIIGYSADDIARYSTERAVSSQQKASEHSLRRQLEISGSRLTGQDVQTLASNLGLGYADNLDAVFQQAELGNFLILEKKCELLARQGLEFYNRLYETSFNRAEAASADAGEEAIPIRTSLERLDEAYAQPDLLLGESRSSSSSSKKMNDDELATLIYSLLDFKEVKDPGVSGKPADRVNDGSQLARVVARHLYIFFTVYPEAALERGCESFTREVPKEGKYALPKAMKKIKRLVEKKVLMDWPSINSVSYRKIARMITTTLQKYIKSSPAESLIQIVDAAESSDDSDLDAVDDLTVGARDMQLGWNCFDIAVGLADHYNIQDEGPTERAKKARQALVRDAFTHSNDPAFRALLAPEIRHAAAITVVHMLANELDQGDKASVERQVNQLLEKCDSLSLSDQEGRLLIGRTLNGLLSRGGRRRQKHAVQFPSICLPEGMRTQELKGIVLAYMDAHENMKSAVSQCNDALGLVGSDRLSLAGLDEYFSNPANQGLHRDAYQAFSADRSRLFSGAETAFDAYCQSEVIYRQYLTQYYGRYEWMSFQGDAVAERSTSMVDITARIMQKNIRIHLPNKSTCVTHVPGIPEIVDVHYNGRNHFSANVPVRARPSAFSASSKKRTGSRAPRHKKSKPDQGGKHSPSGSGLH